MYESPEVLDIFLVFLCKALGQRIDLVLDPSRHLSGILWETKTK